MSDPQAVARFNQEKGNLGPFQGAAQRYANLFKTNYGITLTPQRIMSVAMLESGDPSDYTAGNTPANCVGQDGVGLGVMQMTPDPKHGTFDANVAGALSWNNNKTLDYNKANSAWQNPINNVNAGVLLMANKADTIKRLFPKQWAQMDPDQRWNAVLGAYGPNGIDADFRQRMQEGLSDPQHAAYDDFANLPYQGRIGDFSDYIDTNNPFPQGPVPPAPPYQ